MPKRVAHPGNWFVTTREELVVLDVEDPTCKLYVEELCQLVEDVPVFAWDDEGNQERRNLLQEYRAMALSRSPTGVFGIAPSNAAWPPHRGGRLVASAFAGLARTP